MVKDLKKEKFTLINKNLCFGMLACAFVYGLILPFFWGNNPLDPLGTLSILCEDRKAFFWAWALLTSGAYSMNIKYMQNKYSYKNKLSDVLMVLAVVGMVLVSATLKHDVTTVNPRRVVHWAGAIAFALFTGLALFFFLISQMRRDKKFIVVGAVCAAILLLMLFWLVIIGKSGLMEAIPNGMLQILVGVINFTGVIKPAENKAHEKV